MFVMEAFHIRMESKGLYRTTPREVYEGTIQNHCYMVLGVGLRYLFTACFPLSKQVSWWLDSRARFVRSFRFSSISTNYGCNEMNLVYTNSKPKIVT